MLSRPESSAIISCRGGAFKTATTTGDAMTDRCEFQLDMNAVLSEREKLLDRDAKLRAVELICIEWKHREKSYDSHSYIARIAKLLGVVP